MEIRLATKMDIQGISELYKELFYDMSKLQPEYLRQAEQDKGFLNKIIEENKSDIFIAIEKDKIIGFALLQEQETPPYNCFVKHKYAYVMDLIVNNSYRGKGIGSDLLKEVKKWAKSRNLDYIELSVLSENVDAAKLYEKHEFKNAMQTMRCKL